MIGISTLPYYESDISDILNYLADQRYVEIVEIYAECHDIPNDTLNSFDFEYTVHAPTNDINISSNLERIRTACLDVIEDYAMRASLIDAKRMVIHPGYFIDPFKERFVESHRRSLSYITDNISIEYSIEIAIENMFWPFSFIRTAEEYREINELYGIPLILDIGHAAISGELENFLSCNPVELHIHDNNRRDDEHLGIGLGKIDFSQVIPLLKDKDAIIEVKNKDQICESIQTLSRFL